MTEELTERIKRASMYTHETKLAALNSKNRHNCNSEDATENASSCVIKSEILTPEELPTQNLENGLLFLDVNASVDCKNVKTEILSDPFSTSFMENSSSCVVKREILTPEELQTQNLENGLVFVDVNTSSDCEIVKTEMLSDPFSTNCMETSISRPVGSQQEDVLLNTEDKIKEETDIEFKVDVDEEYKNTKGEKVFEQMNKDNLSLQEHESKGDLSAVINTPNVGKSEMESKEDLHLQVISVNKQLYRNINVDKDLDKSLSTTSLHHLQISKEKKCFAQDIKNKSYKTKHSMVSDATKISDYMGNKILIKDIIETDIIQHINATLCFTCDICSKSFTRKQTMVKHKRIHAGEKPFTCNICNQSFTQKGTLVAHERLHTGEKPFTCNICNKSFTQKGTLVIHERLHTGEKPFSCDTCNKSFNEKQSLVKHKRIHTCEAPFTCDICTKSFYIKQALVKHNRIHTGEKPFRCDLCNQSFTQKGTLVTHKRLHTGEKPFVCDICNKSFGQKAHLVGHKRLHTGEKPFTCNLCNKSFAHKTHMVEHKRIHTGEKPFTCDICNRSFAQKGKLLRHKHVRKDKKTFSCDMCNQSFTQKAYLAKHIVTHS